MDGKSLHRFMPHTDNCFEFTNAQIISYFVSRTADDGLPASDFKSVNSSALSLFRCDHVQKIRVCHQISSSSTFICADCLPEMKKDRVYKVEIELEHSSFDICRVDVQLVEVPLVVASTLQHCAMLWRSLPESSRVQGVNRKAANVESAKTNEAGSNSR